MAREHSSGERSSAPIGPIPCMYTVLSLVGEYSSGERSSAPISRFFLYCPLIGAPTFQSLLCLYIFRKMANETVFNLKCPGLLFAGHVFSCPTVVNIFRSCYPDVHNYSSCAPISGFFCILTFYWSTVSQLCPLHGFDQSELNTLCSSLLWVNPFATLSPIGPIFQSSAC